MLPPPPPKLADIPAGYRLVAGRGHATVLPDLDFETYSEAGYAWDESSGRWAALPGASGDKVGLGVVGAAVYAQHPSTEVLSLKYNLKDGHGPHIWTPGMLPPIGLFAYVAGGGLLEAWNSSFEHWIWNRVCCRKYGWPPLPQSQLRCAMAKSRAHAMPGSLEAAGKQLGCTELKNRDGKRLLAKFSVPQNPRASRCAGTASLLDAAPDAHRDIPTPGDPDTRALYAYNAQDIAAEADASSRCPDLEGDELRYWLVDQAINYRGVAIDTAGVDNCCAIIDQALAAGNAELQRITGGAVEQASQVQRLTKWLHGRGVHLDSMDEDAVTAALAGMPDPTPERRVLEIRAACGSAAVKKAYAMRNQCAPDGRLHDLFSYHAARTGRCTGNGPQPTNLPNSGPGVYRCKCGRYHTRTSCPWCGADAPPERVGWSVCAVEDALEVIASRDLATVEYFYGVGQALAIVSACLRGLFVAAPGHDLISSDYSSIEAVVLAALAGEQWRLDVFHGHGRIYEISAAKITGIPFDEAITHSRRKLGKVSELASGYQGWLGAWKAFGADDFMTDDEIKSAILAWRSDSPAIVELWGGQTRCTTRPDGKRAWAPELYGVEGAAISAIQNPGVEYPVKRLDGTPSGLTYVMTGDALYCRLPSGRYLTYHRPRLRESDRRRGELSISYEGWNTNPKNGPVGWITMDTWGGRLVENAVQAVSRDILRHASILLESCGYPLVIHVYDEVVCEVRAGYGSVEELEAIMADTPDWAVSSDGARWPIRAKGGWRGLRYRK
jgi:DNA polymerase